MRKSWDSILVGARLCLSHMDTGNYDAETVRFFDVAHEGAQIRLLAGEVELWSEALRGLNPRSLVIIPTDAIAREAAHLGVGLAEPLRIPLVVTECSRVTWEHWTWLLS